MPAVTVGTASATAVPALAGRRFLRFVNNGAAIVYVQLGAGPVTVAGGYPLAASGGAFEMSGPHAAEAVQAISGTANINCRYVEA